MKSTSAQSHFATAHLIVQAVTRTTAKRLATVLGVDETQVIHRAHHELAKKYLPQYDADAGALTKAQISQIKKSAPKAKGGVVRTSLFEQGKW